MYSHDKETLQHLKCDTSQPVMSVYLMT